MFNSTLYTIHNDDYNIVQIHLEKIEIFVKTGYIAI